MDLTPFTSACASKAGALLPEPFALHIQQGNTMENPWSIKKASLVWDVRTSFGKDALGLSNKIAGISQKQNTGH